MKKYIRIEQVAVMCGVLVQTINNWYRFKRENPDKQLAMLLPNYTVVGSHGQRFWKESDIEAVIEFKNIMPQGRNGIMGSVTQKYVKKNTSRPKEKDVASSPISKEKNVECHDPSRSIPTAGTVVKHFMYDAEDNKKKYLYVIVGEGTNSETNEKMMVYRELYGKKKLYICSLKEFMSRVDHNKYPNVKQNYRFEQYDG